MEIHEFFVLIIKPVLPTVFCQDSDYIHLTPEEASSEILKRVVDDPHEFLVLRMSIEKELKQRIAELRGEQSA